MNRHCFFAWLIALAIGASIPASAQAQGVTDSDAELAGESREGVFGQQEVPPDDPWRVMGFLGAGIGLRIGPRENSPWFQEVIAPPYLELGGAAFLPGRAVRHGLGVFVSANLISDGGGTRQVDAFNQYTITPSYHLLVPLYRAAGMEHDTVQVQGRLGAPLNLTAQQGGGLSFSPGVELGAAIHYKFLAGLGVYLEATGNLTFGALETLHWLVAFDAGLLWDFEFLP
ncbi:MAG: hypothetical protein ACFCGT_10095 [Sandaracinaceae bacterium]